jgi:hypothetical protein
MQPRLYRQYIVENFNRKRRRVWVVLMYVGLIFWTGCNAFSLETTTEQYTPWFPWPFLAFSFVAALLWFISLCTVSGTMAYTLSGPLVFQVTSEPEERKPDERQRTVQYRAGYRAFAITMCLIGAAYLYWLLAEVFGILPLSVPEPEVLAVILSGAIAMIGSLYIAIMAWTEPDAKE